MEILLTTGFASVASIAYAISTGLTLFDSDFKLEDPRLLFFNSPERENRYIDYNNASFSLAIAIFIASAFIFMIVKWYRKKLTLEFFYIYSIFFLLLSAIFYSLIGSLIFFDLQMNQKNISKQSIIDWTYAFTLIVAAIVILIRAKILVKNNQKSSSSGSIKSLSTSS